MDTSTPPATGGDTQTPAETTPQTATEGATPTTGGDTLGDAGKRALDAERQARKAAAREAADLRKQLDDLRNAGKSDAEKQAAAIASIQDELSQMKAERAQMKAERDRLALSAATGVPVDLLAGPGDDPEAWAKALTDWKSSAAAAEPAPPSWSSFSISTPDKKAPTLPEQIDAAEKAGDRGLVAALKASMLGGH